MQSTINSQKAEEQCEFVEDIGIRNVILILRMLRERAIKVKRSQYVCFLDYTKAFDKVRPAKIFEMLQSLYIDWKDIQ